MSDPLGLSIGTTNLVAARVGNQPVIRRSVLTLPASGVTMGGFVERVGDAVPLVAPDGTSYRADQLLVEALELMIQAAGGQQSSELAIAVPAYWGMPAVRALNDALRWPARLVSDAVTSLNALNTTPGLPDHGVVALLDFGGSGTSITLADAASAFDPIDETTRYVEFSGDQIDQALLSHVLEEIANAGEVDPASTAAVGSLTRLREDCRQAKERLSAETVTELEVELPGYQSGIRVTRTELESLIAGPIAVVLAELENVLERNGIDWAKVSAVVTVGGGASIPLITQRLSEHSSAPVITTPQPALDAALGAALVASGSAADAETGVAPVLPADVAPQDGSGSSTFRALAWSQDDDTADEPVPYTGDDVYDTDVTSTRSPVQYVPATGPIEEPRTWQRLPQLVFGVAAALALIAVGGVAIALTSATGSSESSPSSTAAPPKPPSSELPPPPPPAPQVQTVTVTSERAAATASSADHHRRTGDQVRHHHADDYHDDHNHYDDYDNNDDNHHADDNDHHHDDDAADDDELHHRAVRAGTDPDSGAESGAPAEPVSACALSACLPACALRLIQTADEAGSVRFLGWWHAATWSDSCSTRSGSSVLHTSVHQGQRVWKLQPGGGSMGLGGSPSSTSRSRAALSLGSGIGTADSRAFE